ncbi:hypothetical protein [Lacticaseibacillus suihuaensis]
MHGLLSLELKKHPWSLHLAALLGLLLLFAVPLGHHLGILTTTYRYVAGTRFPSYDPSPATAMEQAAPGQRAAAERQVRADLKANPNLAAAKPALALLAAIRDPLAERDYLTVDRLTLAAITKHPEILDNIQRLDFIENTFTTTQLNLEAKQQILAYYVKHRINALPTIASRGTAAASVYGVFSRYGSHVWKWTMVGTRKHYFYKLNAGTTLTWVFLFYAAFVLTAALGYDQRHNTETLMRMTPRRDLRMVATQAALTIAVIAVVLVALVGLAMLITAIVPGKRLGTLWQPVLHTTPASVYLTPMWQEIALQLGMLWLWAVLLAGVAFLATQLTTNPLLALLLTCAAFFLAPLHVLDALPLAVQKVLPAFYTNPPATLAKAEPFNNTSPATVFLVLAVWAVLVWAGAAVVQQLRYRRLVLGH